MSRGGAILAALAVLAAAPAVAQRAVPPAADPIDALIRRPARDADPEEPDTAASGAAVDPDPLIDPQAGPRAAPKAGPRPDDGSAYEARLKASMAAARGFMGPMEGGWSVMSGGREIYVLQLADRAGAVEGAWRDPARPGALEASGYIDGIDRTGDDLTVHIGGVTLTLHAADGVWSGRLAEAGRSQPVLLRRRGP